MYHQFKQYPNSLRKHRKAAGLRQHEVANALGLNGCERISKWENGAAIPKPDSLFRLAALYRVPPQELFGEMYQPIVPSVGIDGAASAERIPVEGSVSRPSGSTPLT